MTRWRLTIEYEGTNLVGWQRQDNGPSVQAALESAVEAFCGEAVEVVGAGRTDAGVHALGQVAHVEIARAATPKSVRDALNFHLKPEPIAVLDAQEAPADFHARFDAVQRRYRYRIVNRRAPLTLERERAWWVPRILDEEAMAEAAARLVGHHDFSSFRASQCQASSPVKTLDRFEVRRRGNAIVLSVAARSFLHHQVRNMAGTLCLVGEGRMRPEAIDRILEARDRSAAGPTAPAQGLYLVGVDYPPERLEVPG